MAVVAYPDCEQVWRTLYQIFLDEYRERPANYSKLFENPHKQLGNFKISRNKQGKLETTYGNRD